MKIKRRKGAKLIIIRFSLLFAITLGSFRAHSQWQKISIGTDQTLTHISPIKGDTVYVSGFEGLFKTNDFGTTWNTLPIDIPGSYFYKTHFFDSRRGIGIGPITMANSEVIAKTYDGGRHWSMMHVSNGGSWPREFNDIDFLDSQIGYAVGRNGRVLKTANAGESWDVVESNGVTNYLDASFHTANHGYLLSKTHLGAIDSDANLKTKLYNRDRNFVAVEALSETEIIVASENTLRRTIDGSDWDTYALPFSKVTTMFVYSSQTIYLGTEKGLYVTYDGGAKWEIFKETSGTHVKSIYVRSDGKGLVCGRDGAMYKTDNFGGSPVPIIRFSYSEEGACGYTYLHLKNESHSSYEFQWFLDDQLVSEAFEDSVKLTERFNGRLALVASNGSAIDTSVQQLYVYVQSVEADAGADLHLCSNEVATLQATGGFYYSWSPSTGLSDPNIANPVAKHSTTIQYVVSVSKDHGCTDQDTITVFRDEPVSAVSWEKTDLTYNYPIKQMQILNDTLGFAVANDKVLFTRDAGKHWKEKAVIEQAHHLANFHDVQFITPDTGFVVSRFLYKTTDGGKSYSASLASGGGIFDIEFINSKVGYAAVYSSIGSSTSIYKTTDGGKSWKDQISVLGHIFKLACLSDSTCVGVGSSPGDKTLFLQITDGENWAKADYTAGDYQNIHDVHFISDFVGFAVGARGKVWKTVDSGASWKVDYTIEVDYAPTDELYSVKFLNKDRGFIGTYNGHIFQTANGGQCWQDMGKVHTSWIQELHLYKNLLFIPTGETIFKNGIIYRANLLEDSSKFQAVAFEALQEKVYNDKDFRLEAQASSGLPVSYTSSNELVAKINRDSVMIVGVGTAIITASQEGDANYSAAESVSQSLIVNKAADSISFASLPDRIFGDTSFVLKASASSRLPVSFRIISGPAFLSGDRLTATEVGLVTIEASHKGSPNYTATTVLQSFCVMPPTPVITTSGNLLASSSDGGNQWYLNGELVDKATTATYQATIPGDYVVRVTGPCGEAISSDPYTYQEVVVTSLELAIPKEIMIYPNPATGQVVTELPDGEILIQAKLYDATGKQVATLTTKESKIVFYVDDLNEGIYLLKLQTKRRTVIKKLVVQ